MMGYKGLKGTVVLEEGGGEDKPWCKLEYKGVQGYIEGREKGEKWIPSRARV